VTPMEWLLADLASVAATVTVAITLLRRRDRDPEPSAPAAVADFTAHPDADEIAALFAGVLAETDQP